MTWKRRTLHLRLLHLHLEAGECEHGESEAGEDDDVAQILHRLDHRAHNRLEACKEGSTEKSKNVAPILLFPECWDVKRRKQLAPLKLHCGEMRTESIVNTHSPGMMATVFKARRTRKVRKAARLPRSIPMVM